VEQVPHVGHTSVLYLSGWIASFFRAFPPGLISKFLREMLQKGRSFALRPCQLIVLQVSASETLTFYLSSATEFIRMIQVLTMTQTIDGTVNIPNDSMEGRTLKEL
jgi:hypothetical protein